MGQLVSLQKIQDVVFEYLAAERDKREREPSLVDGLHANASSAGACARAIGFRVAGLPASNPLTGDALFNFSVGDAIHEIIQRAMLAKIPSATAEIKGVVGGIITCRADLKYVAEDGKYVCCEIKSVSDFAYKLATGAKLKSNGQWNKKDQVAEGPKREALLQASLSAKALGADYVAIIYARKTASKDDPIIAEWRYKIEDLEDEIQTEFERLKSIVEMVKSNVIPDREYNGEVITNPAKARWPCGYCGHKNSCIQLGEGEVQIP